MNDALMFPIMAGCSLCGLYFAMNYFGKDAVNYFLLFYIGVAGTAGVKAMLYSFVGEKYAEHDQEYIIDFVVKAIGLEL